MPDWQNNRIIGQLWHFEKRDIAIQIHPQNAGVFGQYQAEFLFCGQFDNGVISSSTD